MIYNIDGQICNYGFCVKKKSINPLIVNVLKKYFNVKPELNYENEKIADKDKYFDVYYQDDKYIVLPKFSSNITINIARNNDKKNVTIDNTEYTKITFSIKKFKYSKETSNFEFKGKLRDYQELIISEIFKKFNLNPTKPIQHQLSEALPKGGLIKLSCGGGKCLGFNTPVLLYDGTIKPVQDIIIGDQLMGDDSMPRNILSLARGREQMYKIIQDYGEPYIVNASHILSLYNPKTKKIIDISVMDYLKLNDIYSGPKIENGKTYLLSILKKFKVKGGLYGFRVNTIFKPKPIELEPYLVGLILGKKFINLKKNDSELFKFIEKYNLIENPHLPINYKTNSPYIQLEVLAGLIDTIGTMNNELNSYIINSQDKQLIDDIVFILRSLNFRFTKISEYNNFKLTIYDKMNINIPTRIKQIKFNNYIDNYIDIDIDIDLENEKEKEKEINLSQYNFTIKYHKIHVVQLKEDQYYGFEIDGNKRFLLGDFTVTHNTMLAIYLSWVLGLKTLVVTHKEFLMDQWEKRIQEFTTAKIGRIRQNKIDVEGKDIVIGMLRSLSMKDYPTEILNQFGLVIYDEVHHTGSRVDSQALLKTSAEYTIGLSATPERADGMTKVINWHVGDILYEMEKKYNYRVLVKKIFFRSNDVLFKEKKMYFQGRFAPSHTKMTENLTKIQTRNQLIVNFIDVLKGMGRKILILSYRVEHLEYLKGLVDEKIKADGESHIYNSYYYMGKTKRTEKDMAEKDGHIIFATMQLAEEGLDIAHLDTVLFALPVSIQKDKKNNGKIKSSKTLIQSIGRILRNDTLEDLTQIPLVIDISDMFSIYSGWSNKRNEIYEKKNWYMQNYYWEDLEYQFKSGQDTKINPMNIILDDISDEDFIEKNLMLTEEEAKKITEEDKSTEDKLTEDKSTIATDNSNNSNNSNESDNDNKIDKTTKLEKIKNKDIKSSKKKSSKQKNELENITEPIVTYGFGKSRC